MKIKNTEISFIQGPFSKNASEVSDFSLSCGADQHSVRACISSALNKAEQMNLPSIIFPSVGVKEGFPVIGSAKILSQEFIRHFRREKSSIKEVVVCLETADIYETFKKSIEGYLKHVLETLGPGPYVVVDIIIEVDEGIVLIERSNPPYGWALPGGFVDYGESLEEAAVREAKEETDLDLSNLKQFHTYSAMGRDPRFQTISTVFTAKGSGKPKAGDDAANFKIIDKNDLLIHEYAFDHKQILSDYLER